MQPAMVSVGNIVSKAVGSARTMGFGGWRQFAASLKRFKASTLRSEAEDVHLPPPPALCPPYPVLTNSICTIQLTRGSNDCSGRRRATRPLIHPAHPPPYTYLHTSGTTHAQPSEGFGLFSRLCAGSKPQRPALDTAMFCRSARDSLRAGCSPEPWQSRSSRSRSWLR